MKEIIERFGLSEFFAYISPGIILLSSLGLWAKPDFTSAFWKQEFLVIVIFLILSYTLGLILVTINNIGLTRHLRKSIKKRKGILSKIWGWVICFFSPFLSPHFTPSIVDANLRIAQDLIRISGIGGASAYVNPLDWLVIYRVMKADYVGENCKLVLSEADTFHRRFRFSMGVSLALFLLAIQSILRLFLFCLETFYESIRTFINNAFPSINYFWLIVLIIFGLWSSFTLRKFAIQMWDLERYLTVSLTQVSPLAPEAKDSSDRN